MYTCTYTTRLCKKSLILKKGIGIEFEKKQGNKLMT